MNFNKDYPIAILDTNIVINCPNILDELDKPNLKEKLKKSNKYPKSFLNNLKEISDKTNLYKDGFKLKNGCMLYLDKDNLRHREINFNSRKPDLQFISVAKNFEKYSDIGMEVVILSYDRNMKIYANQFDVKVKTLEEFGNIKKEEFKNTTQEKPFNKQDENKKYQFENTKQKRHSNKEFINTNREFKNINKKPFNKELDNTNKKTSVIGTVTGVIGAIGIIGAGIAGVMSKNKGYKDKIFNRNMYRGLGRKNRRF